MAWCQSDRDSKTGIITVSVKLFVLSIHLPMGIVSPRESGQEELPVLAALAFCKSMYVTGQGEWL